VADLLVNEVPRNLFDDIGGAKQYFLMRFYVVLYLIFSELWATKRKTLLYS